MIPKKVIATGILASLFCFGSFSYAGAPSIPGQFEQENNGKITLSNQEATDILSKMPNSGENLELLKKSSSIKLIKRIMTIETTDRVLYALNIPEYLVEHLYQGTEEIPPDNFGADDSSSLDYKDKLLLEAMENEKKGALWTAGSAYREAGLEDKAKEMFKRSAERFEAERYWTIAGEDYKEAGMEDKAKEMYMSEAKEKEEEQDFYMAGLAYRNAGMEEKAQEMFKLSAGEREAEGDFYTARNIYEEAGMEDKAKEMSKMLEKSIVR